VIVIDPKASGYGSNPHCPCNGGQAYKPRGLRLNEGANQWHLLDALAGEIYHVWAIHWNAST